MASDSITDVASGKRCVAVVGHAVPSGLGGAARSLLDILAAIDKERFEVCCVLPAAQDDYLEAIARHARSTRVFPYRWWNGTRQFDEEVISRFILFLERERVDLVHVNTITLMDPLLAARRLGLPSIVHAREIITEDSELARHFGGDGADIVKKVQMASTSS
jgi:glycosyltransferase involved in cell wall biosynthesis